MKNCISCGVLLTPKNTKPYRIKNHIHKCDDCDRSEKREQARQYREANPNKSSERALNHNKKLRKENPVKYSCIQMASSSKKRASAHGWENNIDSAYLVSIAPVVCPILGFNLKYGGGEKTKASCSIDRIDSSKGYTKGNVQIISNLANLMKSNATKDEMILFAEWVSKNIKSQ